MDDTTRVPAKNETNSNCVDVDLILTGTSNDCDFSVVGSPKGLADLIKNLSPNEAPTPTKKADAD